MEPARNWIRPLARAGYASRGLVYAIIGFFAVLAAFGGGEQKGAKGALRELLEQPFGNVLVWLMIVGLVGYVIWRLVQAFFDTDRHGRGAKGLAIRAGLLASAFAYATLALYALSLVGIFAGGGGGGGGGPAQAIAGIVGARWAALGLALVFAGVAVAHVWKAVSGKYADHFQAGADAMAFIRPVSVIGLTARGLVFAVVALLFFRRFLHAGSEATPGLEQALEYVRGLPFGQWLLAALGAGLLAFAVYSAAEARWRRISVERVG